MNFPLIMQRVTHATSWATLRLISFTLAVSSVCFITFAQAQTPPDHGERVTGGEIILTTENANAVGVAKTDAYYLVLDGTDKINYIYDNNGAFIDPEDRAFDSSSIPFSRLDDAVNADPQDIAVAITGKYAYVLDADDKMLYAYDILSVGQVVNPGVDGAQCDSGVFIAADPTLYPDVESFTDFLPFICEGGYTRGVLRDRMFVPHPPGTRTPDANTGDNSVVGTRVESKDINISMIGMPTSIFAAGNRIWVADSAANKIFAFETTIGRRITTTGSGTTALNPPIRLYTGPVEEEPDAVVDLRELGEFNNLAPMNSNPSAIHLQGSVWYVLDSNARNVFAYNAVTGERLSDLEFDLTTLNRDPTGMVITVDSDAKGLLYVLDGSASRVFAYRFDPIGAWVAADAGRVFTTVEAGPDQTVQPGADVRLRGTVRDSNLSGNNELIHHWGASMVDCDGDGTDDLSTGFRIANDMTNPSAQFIAPPIPDSCSGYYVLTFTYYVDGGDYRGAEGFPSDTLLVTVGTVPLVRTEPLTTLDLGEDQTLQGDTRTVELNPSFTDLDIDDDNEYTYVWRVTTSGCSAVTEIYFSVANHPPNREFSGSTELPVIIGDRDDRLSLVVNKPLIPLGCSSYEITAQLTVTGGEITVSDSVQILTTGTGGTFLEAGADQNFPNAISAESFELNAIFRDTNVDGNNAYSYSWSFDIEGCTNLLGVDAYLDPTADYDPVEAGLITLTTVSDASFTTASRAISVAGEKPAVPLRCSAYAIIATLTVTGGDGGTLTDSVRLTSFAEPAFLRDTATVHILATAEGGGTQGRNLQPGTQITATVPAILINDRGSADYSYSWTVEAACGARFGTPDNPLVPIAEVVANPPSSSFYTRYSITFTAPAIPDDCDRYVLSVAVTVVVNGFVYRPNLPAASGSGATAATSEVIDTIRVVRLFTAGAGTVEGLNAAILPRLAQVIGNQSAEVVAERIGQIGQVRIASASLRLGGVEVTDYVGSTSSEKSVTLGALLPDVAGDASGLEVLPANSGTGTQWLSLLSEYAKTNVDEIDSKVLLGNSEFVLPLRDKQHSNGFTSTAFWGSGNYRNLSDESEESGIDWDGNLVGVNLGVDTSWTSASGGKLLGGLAISWTEGDIEYTSTSGTGTSDGEYALNLVGAHPYVGWHFDSTDLWASVGYGVGEIEITEASSVLSVDLEFQNAGFGGSSELWKWGDTTLRAKGSTQVSKLLASENIDIGLLADSFRTNLVNLGVEISHRVNLANGAYMEPAFGLGARNSSDESGNGLAIEASVKRVDNEAGVIMEGRLHGLVGSENYKEWGIEGVARKQSGRDGQGIGLHIAPGYGEVRNEIDQMWNKEWVVGVSDESEYAPRLLVEMDYGMTPHTVLGRAFRGLLTPYSELVLSNTSDRYRLGLRWQLGASSPTISDYTFHLDLFGQQHVSSSISNTMLLKGELRF